MVVLAGLLIPSLDMHFIFFTSSVLTIKAKPISALAPLQLITTLITFSHHKHLIFGIVYHSIIWIKPWPLFIWCTFEVRLWTLASSASAITQQWCRHGHGDMWNTYPDISLSLRETQHSSLIAIKYTASLGYILLTIFSRISYYFGSRGAARIITTWHFNMQPLSNVAAPPVFLRVQLSCTGVKLVLPIPWLSLETDRVL